MRPAKIGRVGVKPTIRFSVELAKLKFTKAADAISFVLPKGACAGVPPGGVSTEGTLNGFPFQSVLKSDRKGSCQLVVSAAVYTAAVRDGEMCAIIEIVRVGDELEVRVPKELRKALELVPKARELWADITPIARRDWVYWISTAKQTETRVHRVETTCSKLESGMRRVCCFPGVKWLMKNGGIKGKK